MTIIFSKIQFVFLFNDAQNFFVRIAQGLQAIYYMILYFINSFINIIIMGPLSRPRSKILRVAVSRIILSSEASKVKLVGNLVA